MRKISKINLEKIKLYLSFEFKQKYFNSFRNVPLLLIFFYNE